LCGSCGLKWIFGGLAATFLIFFLIMPPSAGADQIDHVFKRAEHQGRKFPFSCRHLANPSAEGGFNPLMIRRSGRKATKNPF